MHLLQHFENALRQHQLLQPGDKVFVACSGGPDSVALFRLLLALQEKWRLKLGLLHFHHGLRGKNADRDRDFVLALGRKHGLPIYIGKKAFLKQARKNRESIEEAARHARYAFFLQTARKHRIPKIALAHTQDDQAETVLMRLIQGTGVRGLSGIRRTLRHGKVLFVRPLLDCRKADLLDYLKKEKAGFCRDGTNHSVRFVRNRIRKRLLPWLEKEFNPRIIQALARVPVTLQEESEWLTAVEEKAFWEVSLHRRGSRLGLDRQKFLQFAAPLQFRVLNRALQTLDVRSGLDFDAWQRLRLGLGRPRYRHSLPRDIDLDLTPSALRLYKKAVGRKS
jgi:tRNA(Ile)-lysidine synthase